MTATKRYALAKLFRVTCYLDRQSHNECWPLDKRQRAANPGFVAGNRDGLRTKPQVAEAKRLRQDYRRAIGFIRAHEAQLIVGEHRRPVIGFTYWRLRPTATDSEIVA